MSKSSRLVSTGKSSIETKRRSEFQLKSKESSWTTSAATPGTIPAYNAKTDALCPKGVISKYNEDKQLQNKEMNKSSSKWMKSNLQAKAPGLTVKFDVTLQPSVPVTADTPLENEILQKIVVRENLLSELKTNLQNQNDIPSAIYEISELVKAIRFQTVEIIENMNDWALSSISKITSFLFRGEKYVLKVIEDMSFLDQYEDITAFFGFEFTTNPLCHEHGDLSVLTETSPYAIPLIKSTKIMNQLNSKVLDGISQNRILAVESILRQAMAFISKQKSTYKPTSHSHIQNHINNVQAVSLNTVPSTTTTASNPNHDLTIEQINHHSGNDITSSLVAEEQRLQPIHQHQQQSNNVKKAKAKSNSKTLPYGVGTELSQASVVSLVSSKAISKSLSANKASQKFESTEKMKFVKKVRSLNSTLKTSVNRRKERIACLTEEVSELMAMENQIEDKIQEEISRYEEYSKARAILKRKRENYISNGNEGMSQKIALEISMKTADMSDSNDSIKGMEKKAYNLAQERHRRTLLIKQLNKEMEEEKHKIELQKLLVAKTKKSGIIPMLGSLQNSEEIMGHLAKLEKTKGALAEMERRASPNGREEEGIASTESAEDLRREFMAEYNRSIDESKTSLSSLEAMEENENDVDEDDRVDNGSGEEIDETDMVEKGEDYERGNDQFAENTSSLAMSFDSLVMSQDNTYRRRKSHENDIEDDLVRRQSYDTSNSPFMHLQNKDIFNESLEDGSGFGSTCGSASQIQETNKIVANSTTTSSAIDLDDDLDDFVYSDHGSSICDDGSAGGGGRITSTGGGVQSNGDPTWRGSQGSWGGSSLTNGGGTDLGLEEDSESSYNSSSSPNNNNNNNDIMRPRTDDDCRISSGIGIITSITVNSRDVESLCNFDEKGAVITVANENDMNKREEVVEDGNRSRLGSIDSEL